MATESGWRDPMLATLTDQPFSHENWVFERKLDGIRAICSRSGGRPRLWSRNHRTLDESYPEIVEALEAHGAPDFIADGEIVAFDGSRTSFAKLQQRIHLTDPKRIEAAGVWVCYYLYTPPGGSRIGFGALLIGYHDGSGLRYAGKVGTGYNDATLRELSAKLTGMTQRHSPFNDPVPDRQARWIAPELVVQVAFSDWTSDGRLRHPRFTGLRDDKAAGEVTRERP